MNIREHWGERIAEHREREGLSRAEFAARVDITAEELAEIEAGKRRLQAKLALKIADNLRVNPANLLSG